MQFGGECRCCYKVKKKKKTSDRYVSCFLSFVESLKYYIVKCSQLIIKEALTDVLHHIIKDMCKLSLGTLRLVFLDVSWKLLDMDQTSQHQEKPWKHSAEEYGQPFVGDAVLMWPWEQIVSLEL